MATVRYWREQGLEPAGCLEALGCAGPESATWAEVEVAALMHEARLDAARRDREKRRRAVIARAVREPGSDLLEHELRPAAMRVME